jgi:Na+/melibiose symporter-like transporter
MAGSGFAQAFWMIVVFPPLHKRIGSIGVLRICSIIWPFLFALCPFANFLLRQGYETAFWVLYPSLTFIGLSVSMAFSTYPLDDTPEFSPYVDC